MPITREPRPRPSELDYVPPNGAPYKVTANDSWWTLAKHPECTSAGMSALDLCHYNFRTRNPAAINWYLYNKIGCRSVTRDGDNYVFTDADRPGIVYLPQQGRVSPAGEISRKRAGRHNAWLGLATKAGTQVVVVGVETVAGVAVSLDDSTDWMALTASINRVGPGWGASGSIAGVYIVGVDDPTTLNGHQEGDWDFNLALGPNWGRAARAASKTSGLQPLAHALRKLGAATPSRFKQLVKAHPDKYAELVDSCRSLNETIGAGEGAAGPKVILFDLPLGGGLEASVYFGVANFNAVWDNL